MSASATDFEAIRAQKLQAIAATGVDPWGHRVDGLMSIADVLQLPADQPEGSRPRAKVAGRIVLRRDSGKVHWVDLWDWTTPLRLNKETNEYERGKIQVMVGQKQVGADGWIIAENLDLGDLLCVEGTFGKTRMGEPTIFAEKLTFLGKSLQ
ncbi:MAG: lysine--tRNA ligase, partial [Gemmataceae bacterium]